MQYINGQMLKGNKQKIHKRKVKLRNKQVEKNWFVMETANNTKY